MKRLAAFLGLAALPVLGCTIIINPSGGDDGMGPPIPIPLTCAPGNVAPTVHMIFSTRIERTTVNLAEHYAAFMTNTGLAMAGAGLQPTHAVLLRADERPVETKVLGAWGCALDSPEQLPPAEVIRHYATKEELAESPLSCVTDTLQAAGADMSSLVTRYPPSLPGGTNSVRIFGDTPDVLLVVHLDGLERRTALADAECNDAIRLAEKGSDGSAAWVRYAGGSVPMERVVHWFVATEEGIDRSTFVEGCRRFDGFPADVLDVLEPSPQFVYSPLVDAIKSAGGSAGYQPMCAMLGGDADFFTSQAKLIGGMLGLEVDEDAVLEFIQNGGKPPDLPEGGRFEDISPG